MRKKCSSNHFKQVQKCHLIIFNKKSFTWMTLARASLAASASAAMARCTHLQSWERKFDPRPFIFFVIKSIFNFIFFFMCQSSLHRFTKFGTEVGSKAFNFGIYLSISSLFVIICQGDQRRNSWIWNSDGTISQIWQQPKWDTTTGDSGIYWASKNLSIYLKQSTKRVMIETNA